MSVAICRAALLRSTCFVLLVVTQNVVTTASLEAGSPNLGLGHEYAIRGSHHDFLLPDPLTDPSIVADHPLYVRVRVPWALLEQQPGAYRWSQLDEVIDAYRSAHYVVTLCPTGANALYAPDGALPSQERPEVLKGWLDFLRAMAVHFSGRVSYYEIWDEPNREIEWTDHRVTAYAFVLKNSSVTIRSADPAARIVQGGIALGRESIDEDLDWQRALYAEETATYADVLPIHPGSTPSLDRAVSRAYDLMLDHDPSAQLWVNALPIVGTIARERARVLLESFIVALGEGAAVVTFDLRPGRQRGPELPAILKDLHRLFVPTFGLVHGATPDFEPIPRGGRRTLDGISAYQFFDAGTFQGLIAFFVRSAPPVDEADVVIDTAAVRGAAIYDIIGGFAGPLSNVRPDFSSNTTRAPVPLRSRTQVVQYARVPIEGFETDREELRIADTGLITVEEIIANHQRFMTDQNYRLRNYRAEGKVGYHYTFSGVNFDVQTDNNFYWDGQTGAEWEQRNLYFNGVRWKHRKLPALPFIQPEKVATLPLDINLNRDYAFEYLSDDVVDGRACHVVAFEPLEGTQSLYKGRVWIEKGTFARVKIASVQTNLTLPTVSNDELNYYAPFAGPDGTTYWLLHRVEGQQIFTTAGRNLVLNREIELTGFRINGDEFETARRQAYDSDRQILRDTDSGLRYLEKTDDGERRINTETTKSTLLGIAGVFKQQGIDYPVPLAGINYFDYRFRGRDIQLNAFIAGLLNTFTLTNPSLFDRRVDATVEALLLIPNVTDQYYLRGEEREESHVDARFQSLSGNLGWPLGNFVRLKAIYGLEYVNYSRDDDTDTFEVPSDTAIHSGGIEWEFNRRAWTISAAGRRSYRASWEPWGDTTVASASTLVDFPGAACDTPGSCLTEFDPEQDTYDRYEFEVAKQFFLPLFQKLRFSGSWFTGSGLDRFSEFQFSFFGTRVRGLSGSGVRFDRGGIARAQYSFNIGDLIRFNASLDHARVKDGLTSREFSRFTGFGVSGTVPGPWRSFVQFDVGFALQADFAELEGDTEYQLILLKFF